jgi:hypothetical protein
MLNKNMASIFSVSHQTIQYIFSIFTGLSVYDLIFIFVAIACNLLIAGIFIATKFDRPNARKILGIIFMLMALPLAVVFIYYLVKGRNIWIIIRFGFIFLYFLAELLLDFVFKYDFREKWITHAPYIILEYIALFCFIGIATDIDKMWGWIVGIAFWILLGCLIYLYWDKITRRKKKA